MPKHRSFNVKWKLNAIDWHRNNGEVISRTAREFNVDRKRIREWLAREDELRLHSRGSAAKLKRLHPGGTVCDELDLSP